MKRRSNRSTSESLLVVLLAAAIVATLNFFPTETRAQYEFVPRNQVCGLACEQPEREDQSELEDDLLGQRLVAEIGLGLASEGLGYALIVGAMADADAGLGEALLAFSTTLVVVPTMTFATPGLVTLGGDLNEGRGGYGWALLGGIAGRALGGIASSVTSDYRIDAAISSLFAVAGSVLAYELDHSDEEVPAYAGGLSIRPAVDLTPDRRGALVGIVGSM